MMTLDGRAFEHFLQQGRNDLRRIVRQSLDHIGMCEVELEVWLAAQALSNR